MRKKILALLCAGTAVLLAFACTSSNGTPTGTCPDPTMVYNAGVGTTCSEGLVCHAHVDLGACPGQQHQFQDFDCTCTSGRFQCPEAMALMCSTHCAVGAPCSMGMQCADPTMGGKLLVCGPNGTFKVPDCDPKNPDLDGGPCMQCFCTSDGVVQCTANECGDGGDGGDGATEAGDGGKGDASDGSPMDSPAESATDSSSDAPDAG